MRVKPALASAALVLPLLIAGCGADPGDAGAATTASAGEPAASPSAESVSPQAPTSEEPAPVGGDACALLEPAVLDAVMEGEKTMLGTAFEFREGLPAPSGGFCTWKEGNTGLSVQLTLEPTATAEVEDHSGRAYNIDVEPEVEPQDGPGTSAVLLTDPAFKDSTGSTVPYGYFFVLGDQTIYVKSVGLGLDGAQLRALAEEAATALPAG
ncbi:MAG: hypothetical protein ABIU87_09895 [Ornithinibacter sp.]